MTELGARVAKAMAYACEGSFNRTWEEVPRMAQHYYLTCAAVAVQAIGIAEILDVLRAVGEPAYAEEISAQALERARALYKELGGE